MAESSEPGVVVASATSYYCPTMQQLGSARCPGVLVFKPGEMLAQCSHCATWWPITAPVLVPLPHRQNGASRGLAERAVFRIMGRQEIQLRCWDPFCHWTERISAIEFQVGAIVQVSNEHECPTPASPEVRAAMERVNGSPS